MIEMSKQLSLKVALILFLSAGPSAACDPEEMINELRAQCREGHHLRGRIDRADKAGIDDAGTQRR